MLLEDDTFWARQKILNAIVSEPEIVLLLKEKYIDEEIWKFCIEREPSLFKKMKHPSPSLCMFACEIDGANLKTIKNKFTYVPITDTMVLTAVKSNPKALKIAPKKFITTELKEIAFDGDPSLMEDYSDIRPKYLEKLIEERPSALRYVKEPDEAIICEGIKKNPNICTYLQCITPKMLNTLEDYHPQYFQLFKKGIPNQN